MTRRPLHPLLARIALALLLAASALDFAGLAWRDDPWHALAAAVLGAGLVAGLLAVIAGVAEIYLRDIPAPALRWLLAHAAAMHVGLVLFLVSFLLRGDGPPSLAAGWVEVAGTLLLVGGAVLGDRLVSRFRVGLPPAHAVPRTG
jgi:uncharacterized membrane protein